MTPAAEPHEDSSAQMFKDSEAAFAAATEQTVQRDAFGELLARTTENVMALTKIAFDVADVIVRSLRLAGRRIGARYPGSRRPPTRTASRDGTGRDSRRESRARRHRAKY